MSIKIGTKGDDAITNPKYFDVDEDGVLNIPESELLFLDYDPDGDPLAPIIIKTPPQFGTLEELDFENLK